VTGVTDRNSVATQRQLDSIDTHANRKSNSGYDAVDIAHDIGVPEAQHAVALRLQIPVRISSFAVFSAC
jgi:hypothetical protein